MKKIYAISIVLLSLAIPAFARDGKMVLRDIKGNAYTMDIRSIEMDGNFVKYAWNPTHREARRIARGVGCPYAAKVKRAVIYNASDCSGNKIYKAVNVQLFDAKGNIIWNQASDRAQLTGNAPKPNSVFSLFHETACDLTQKLSKNPRPKEVNEDTLLLPLEKNAFDKYLMF